MKMMFVRREEEEARVVLEIRKCRIFTQNEFRGCMSSILTLLAVVFKLVRL